MKQNKDSYELIKQTLNKLPRHTCVKFALFCAKDVFQYADEKDKNIVKATLDLVELWLTDSTKVSNEDLNKAAHSAHSAANSASAHSAHAAAYSAANSAYSAAYSAANSASAHSAHAAAYSAYSANSAYYSASATSATSAAHAAASAKFNEKYEQYYNYLISIITPLQKAIFFKEYNPN